MARTWSILLSALLATTALAGCTGGDDAGDATDPTPTSPTISDPMFPTVTTPATPMPATPTANATLDSSTYALAVAGFPSQAKPGAVDFTLYVNGSVTHESQHIGAHYADNDTVDPPAAGRKDCLHQTGTIPGTFNVSCTMETGAWFVWGHAQINDSGELRNWWAPEPSLVRVRDYELALGGIPTNAQASGGNFTVRLNVTALGGSDNATSDHIGVHYWNASEPNPTLQNAAGACDHVAGGVVGSHTITCRITNEPGLPQDFFLRGHVRITEGDVALTWWSDEETVSILGAVPVPG